MANERLMPAHIRIDWAYPEAFADLSAPTVAELNSTLMKFNVSCAIEDGYTLNQTESDTDDSRTICDVGQVSNRTFLTYEASLDGFRDASLTDNGVFNLFFRLAKAKDVPVVLVKRIGKVNDAPYAVGDIVSLYSFTTDNPVDVVDDVTNIMFGARFKPTGGVNINYKVVA